MIIWSATKEGGLLGNFRGGFLVDGDLAKFSAEEEFILQVAKKMHESNCECSIGRCFGSSLAFASGLRQMGVQIVLIRWRVLRDKQFADHWAIRLNQDFAIDLTSIQFEMQGKVLQKIKSYPENFVNLREYPFQIFLEQYERECGGGANQFSAQSMLRFSLAMFNYDLVRASSERKWLHMATLLSRFAGEFFFLAAGSLNAWAKKRKEELLSKLHVADV